MRSSPANRCPVYSVHALQRERRMTVARLTVDTGGILYHTVESKRTLLSINIRGPARLTGQRKCPLLPKCLRRPRPGSRPE